MDTEQIDELLQRYTTAEHRIGANLHDLELNSAYQVLSTERPSGITGQRVGAALDTKAGMWGLFLALQSTLEQARTLRSANKRLSTPQRAELEELLTGPSVAVHDDPLSPERSAPIEAVLSDIRRRYETVRAAVVDIEEAMLTLVPRLSAIEQTLARVRSDAESLGIASPELADAETRLAVLLERGTVDPLSVRKHAINQVEALARELSTDITATRRSRDELHGDLAEAADLVAEIRRLRATADEGRRKSLAVLANPIGLVRVPGPAAIDAEHGIATTLAAITTASGTWQTVRTMLDDWHRKAAAFKRQLARADGSNRIGLDRRSELRGLLGGLRAKMAGLGLDRNPALMEIVDEAHHELFTAPTDLGRAERLVRELGNQLHEAAR